MAVILFASMSLIASVISMLFGVMVLIKDKHSQLNRIFMLLCLTVSYTAFAEFQLRQSANAEQANFWIRANFLWPFMIIAVFHFVLIYTGQRRLLDRKLIFMVLYGSAAALSLLDLATPRFTGGPVESFWGWSYEVPETTLFYLVTSAIVVLLFAAEYFALRFYLKQDDPAKKKQARLVLLGLSIPIIVGSLDDVLLPSLKLEIPGMATIAFAVGVAGFVGYAIWRHELFGITSTQTAEKIVATISDSLFLVDAHGIVTTTNRAAVDLLGYRENEIVGLPLTKVFGENRMTNSPAARQGASGDTEDVSDLETTLITKKKQSIPVSISSSTLRDRSERVLGNVIIARDISERKSAAARILAQSEELKAVNGELLTLNRITAEISQTIDLDNMLHHALDVIADSGLFHIQNKGGILIAEGEKLNLVSHLGHDHEFLELHKNLTFDDCLCGLAARTREIVVSSNCHDDERHTIRYPGMEDHGHAIVPLKTADQVVGVLYLYLPVGAEINQSERDLLQNIGSQLAVSIENARLFEQTKAFSLHDPLTGLGNRRLMREELKKAGSVARRSGRPFSVIMLDLDYFKKYNDTYGHPAGDRLLADLAMLIFKELRSIDVAVRYGGEEFLAILPDTSSEQAVKVAERIRETIESTEFFLPGGRQPTRMTVSLGVATRDGKMDNEEILLARADASLYSAKNNGRNRVEVWAEP